MSAYRAAFTGGDTALTADRFLTFTPAVGDLLIVFCNVSTNTNATPTCSDNNADGLGAYSLITTAAWGSSVSMGSAFIRNSLVGSATSTTLTVATGSNTAGQIGVIAVSGASGGGAAAVRQFVARENQGGVIPSITFSVAADAANLLLGALMNSNVGGAVGTPPSAFTEQIDASQTLPTTGLEVITRDSGFSGTTIVWGTTSSPHAVMVIELGGAADTTLAGALAGAGTLAADLTTDITMAAALSGAGTLVADFAADMTLAAVLSGTGTLTAPLTTGSPPPTFVAVGALATNVTTASMPITAPTLAVNDIMIACLINKALGNVISPPDGTWTQIIQDDTDCTIANDDHRFAIFWKRAVSGNSGAAFTFTKATDDNLLFAGIISAWRGCVATGNPIDGGAVSKTAGAIDNVSFPAITTVNPNELVLFVAFYGQDATTFAAAMSSDVNPGCTLRFDQENSGGTDCTIACTSGPLTDAGTVAARTWASNATTDAGSAGVVFGLISSLASGGTVFELTVGGTLALAGGVAWQPVKLYGSTLPSAGALLRAPAKRLIGILNQSGTLGPAALSKVFASTVPLAGALTSQRQQTRSLAGTVAATGIVIKVPVKFMKSNVGIVRRLLMNAFLTLQPVKTMTSVLPMTGTVTTSPMIRHMVGVLGLTGTVQQIRSQTVTLGGTLPMAGVVSRRMALAMSGVLTSVGLVRLQVARVFASLITSTGTLLIDVTVRVAGLLPSAGTMTTEQGQAIALAGVVAAAGQVQVVPGLDLPGSLGLDSQLLSQPIIDFQGSITSDGVVQVGMDMQLSGMLGLDGVVDLTGDRMLVLDGEVPLSGSTLVAQQIKLTGLLNPTGLQRRNPIKTLRSILALSGDVDTGFSKSLTGGLALSGKLVRAVTRRWTGVLTPRGVVSKRVTRQQTSSLGFIGQVTIQGAQIVSMFGSLVPSGLLTAPTRVSLWTGVLAPMGAVILLPATLVRHGTIKLINAILRFAGLTAPKLTGRGTTKDPALGDHSTLDDSELR